MTTALSLADVLPPEALANGGLAPSVAALAARAEAVVRPRSTEEVSGALRWAAANDVGVVAVASGERARTKALDGAYMVLATDRLTGVEIYEPADVTITALAGTRLTEIGEALAAHRQWLPFDPPRVTSRSLGGLVASGESGPVGTGYGELRNHVLGATVVCGDGRVLHLGGRVVKNVAGFDLLRPVVGGRGRLGVITSVCLRAFPVPAEDRLLVHRSDDVAGLAASARAVRTAPVLPASVVACASAKALGGGAALVVRLHGAAPTVEADRAMLERHCGLTFEIAGDAASVLEEVRDQAADGGVVLRLSLLPSRLFEGLAAASELLGDFEGVADAYGGSARIAADELDREAVRRLRGRVEGLGGALSVVSADAGRDVTDLGSRPSPEEVELAERLERVFDPAGVMWPCRA